jgi:hypothetical protein
MKLVKNKSSGRFFLVLEDTGGARFVLVTPEGKVKRLERRLFGAHISADHQDSQWDSLLTRVQMDTYAAYDTEVDY